jgi:aminopeptidase N
LDLKDNMTVDSVVLGTSQLSFTHSSDELNITLDRTYNENEIVSLIVYYQGLPSQTGFQSFKFGSHSGQPIISSLSEPYGTSDWWPCKDSPADKPDSADIILTVRDDLIPISNGTLQSTVNNGDGTHTYHWKCHYPIAQYLISVAITNYHQYDTYYHYGVNDSMVITHYVYPESFNGIKTLLDETDDMIEVFSESYGQYPFINERYGHAEFDWSGAMEHQTCSSMGFWGTDVIAHELAHQWYGDMITCADWHHIWLNEGFATYSEAIYKEARDGQAAYNSKIQIEMSSARTATGTIWVQDITQIWEIFNGARSYAKGATVLHMLRGIVGDSTFFDIMRTYSTDPSVSYGAATTEDFQAIAESVYGSSLDYFFQEWIYGENYPKYTIEWTKSHLSGETYHISLTINQTVNSNPSYFTLPVQVKFNTVLGDTTVTLFNNQQVQNYQFEINGDPQSISFDPGNWILKTLQGVTEVEDITVPQKFSLEQNYPNPFNPTTNIKFRITNFALVTLKVYDVLGNEFITLVNEEKEAGSYKVEFSTNDLQLTSGIYFYTLTAGNFNATKKMILMK